MLKPTSNRLDYGNVLAPPAGYETVYAIGTTYSLDLDALIGASIALGLSESIDSDLKDNPIYLLEALKRTADKVALFCESGQIQVPYQAKVLHSLLESMVIEVSMRNKKSFHPKFWLVKYENELGEDLFRCIVLSRNLTFDRSWDIAVCLEGRIKVDNRIKYGHEKSKPINAFLESLLKLAKRGMLDSKKKKMISMAAQEVLDVKFELLDQTYTDFQFIPIGIAEFTADQMGLSTSFHEMFMMTPFLSDTTIKQIDQCALTSASRNTLITRKCELGKLKPESVAHFDVYVMKDIVVDGEDAISDSEEVSDKDVKQKQDIHAKLYLRTKYSDSELYMGSYNASENACHGNIEFMFKFAGKRRYLNVDQLKRDIFGAEEKENPFEKVVEFTSTGPASMSLQDKLQKQIKDICRLKASAIVEQQEDKYSVMVTFGKLSDGLNVTLSPIFSPVKEQPLNSIMRFDMIPLIQLSEFYILTASEDSESVHRLIKIPTENIPAERNQKIVNDIIKDRRGFMQYLSFILGEDYLLSALENQKHISDTLLQHQGFEMPAMYEKMLKAAAHSPSKLAEIKRMMDMISDDAIIPDSFKELFKVFQEVIKK